jgi:predicted site-specific integrase-resolvase
MAERKLSTTEVLEILNIPRATLLYHMRVLRGVLKVSKDSTGRYQFTKAQVEVLKRQIRDRRRPQKPDGDDGDDVERFHD